MSIHDDADEMFAILRRQRTPREAAALLCFVRAKLQISAGGDSEPKIRGMIKNDDDALLKTWSDLTGIALRS